MKDLGCIVLYAAPVYLHVPLCGALCVPSLLQYVVYVMSNRLKLVPNNFALACLVSAQLTPRRQKSKRE